MSFIRCPICTHDWQPWVSDTCEGCRACMLDSGRLKMPRRARTFRDSDEYEVASYLAAGATPAWIAERLGIALGQVRVASGRFATRIESIEDVADAHGFGWVPLSCRDADWYADALDALARAEGLSS